MILFAYAGNMDFEGFRGSVPSAKKLGIGKLPGYEFTFNTISADDSSKANVVQSSEPDASVWGVLMVVDENEKGNFFNLDSNSNDLKLEQLTCFDESGKLYQAHVFIAKPHAVSTYLLPYDWYRERIIKLALHAGLPVDYIDKISALPCKSDPDTERAEKRRKRFRLQ